MCGPSGSQCLPFTIVAQGPVSCCPQLFAAMGQACNCHKNPGINLPDYGRLGHRIATEMRSEDERKTFISMGFISGIFKS